MTADGKLKNCLFSTEEHDLLSVLRKGQDIRAAIYDCFNRKHASRGGLVPFNDPNARHEYKQGRSMIAIGG